MAWDQATRAEARDFCQWIQMTAKPGAGQGGDGGHASVSGLAVAGPGDARAGTRNPVTGKAAPGRWYAPAPTATRLHWTESNSPNDRLPPIRTADPGGLEPIAYDAILSAEFPVGRFL